MGTECRIARQTQALIKGGGGTQGRVRLLFDLGSNRSSVTAKAALKYELPVSFKNEIEFLEGKYSVKMPWKLGHDP